VLVLVLLLERQGKMGRDRARPSLR
jgi:hypothetical protein